MTELVAFADRHFWALWWLVLLAPTFRLFSATAAGIVAVALKNE